MSYRNLFNRCEYVWVLLLYVIGTKAFALDCTVDGHGPYQVTEKKCLELGQQQARTKCVLEAHSLEIELKMESKKNEKAYVCAAKYRSENEVSDKKDSEDCSVLKCRVQK